MWNRILGWFGEINQRDQLILEFNNSAKANFIKGDTLTLLEAKVTIGSRGFKHHFSKFMASGFRITALSGSPLEKSELVKIGKTILDDDTLVRKLITLGWDTLEVNDVNENYGCKWPLKDHAKMDR